MYTLSDVIAITLIFYAQIVTIKCDMLMLILRVIIGITNGEGVDQREKLSLQILIVLQIRLLKEGLIYGVKRGALFLAEPSHLIIPRWSL